MKYALFGVVMDLKKSARKKIAFGVGAVVLAVAAGIAISVLEPFAERFEGKTVRQWVRYYAEQPRAQVEYLKIYEMRGTNALVEERVIDGFGTNAFKRLIAECEPAFYRSWLIELEIALDGPMGLRRPLQRLNDRRSRIEAVARVWANDWAEKNEKELLQMLLTNADDDFVLKVFGLTTDPIVGVSVLDRFTNHPDKAVRERVMKLQRQ